MPTAIELMAAMILEAAAKAEIGIIVNVQKEAVTSVSAITPTIYAKQILYRFRREFNDERYLALKIHFSPDNPDNELWLMKGELRSYSKPDINNNYTVGPTEVEEDL